MHIIRYTSDRQLTLEGFSLPFGGELNPENRWIKWHKVLAPSLFVEIRKRMGKDVFSAFKEVILEKLALSEKSTANETEKRMKARKSQLKIREQCLLMQRLLSKRFVTRLI